MRHGNSCRRLGVLALTLGGFLALFASSALAQDKPQPDIEAGKEAYLQSCARCHGPQGDANVPFAKRFYPRPRDFTKGVYKFRSTVSGTPPTDEDLFKTIESGLHGSNMPDWKLLAPETRWQIVYYLKTLAPIFQETPPEPVAVAADPGSNADIKKGRQVFEQLGCASCHGVNGRANGLSSATLVDDWNAAIRPANLSYGWSYRGGSAPKEIMIRMLAGIDGSGMPSYSGAVSPEDAWHLAYYVASLQEEAFWNPIAHGAYIHGALPSSPDDSSWEQAEPNDLRLRQAIEADGSWAHPATTNKVRVQVLHNNQDVAVRLTWDDPSEDKSSGSADSVSLILRPEGVAGDQVSLQVWPFRGAPALDLCTWVADGTLLGEVVADSFEQNVFNSSEKVMLAGSARYEDGQWQLVIQRPLAQAKLAGGAVLKHGELLPIAVAVWDAGNPGARAVTTWLDVRLDGGPVESADAGH